MSNRYRRHLMFIENPMNTKTSDPGQGRISVCHTDCYKHAIPPGLKTWMDLYHRRAKPQFNRSLTSQFKKCIQSILCQKGLAIFAKNDYLCCVFKQLQGFIT